MANGGDTAEFIDITHARPGLKRELVFVLQSQAENGGSLGRTRTRKFTNGGLGDDVSDDNKNKRLKSLVVKGCSDIWTDDDDVDVGNERVGNVIEDDVEMVNGVSDEEPKSDVVDMINDAEHKDILVDMTIEKSDKGEESRVMSSQGVVMGKLENRMSKKKALEEVPTRLKELLETGLLQGQWVKYQRGSKTRGTLGDAFEGMISGSGIRCFCLICDGTKIVSPNKFELHAGSANKRPPDYIYLENGKNLREVLLACRNVSLELLEVTVNSVIGGSSAEKDVLCQNCKSSITGGGCKEKLLCRPCKFVIEDKPGMVLTVDVENSPASTLNMEESQPCPKPVCDSKQPKASLASVQDNKFRSRKTPSTRPSNSDVTCSSQRKGKITRKDIRLHKLVFQDDILPDGTELAYFVRGEKRADGFKKGLGIFCNCCQSEVSPSQFEVHAGCASRRKPYLHIYTSNGVSLHELALRLSSLRKLNEEESDDLCSVCAEGGDILCCDNCPRAYHTDCISLPCIPTETWFCKYCQSMMEREKFVENNANAIAAGRIVGTDPLEEISKRCIRVLGTVEADLGGCVLCSSPEFIKSGFDAKVVLICEQCEKEYHIGCLKEHGMEDLKEVPAGEWLCCSECSRINSDLEKLVASGDKCLPESLLSIVKTKMEEKGCEGCADLDITWRLLSGKRVPEASEESKMLSKAVAIFHDRFDPVADSISGVGDLIPDMVFGRRKKNQDFSGMYCAVLKVNSNIVSAGIIRMFGEGVAELPLVATSTESQGQGYFQVLFSCMENLLVFLNVKKLVLPAADDAKSLWTNKFGFNVLPKDELMKYQKEHQMMVFQGTTMLQKMVVSSEACLEKWIY